MEWKIVIQGNPGGQRERGRRELLSTHIILIFHRLSIRLLEISNYYTGVHVDIFLIFFIRKTYTPTRSPYD